MHNSLVVGPPTEQKFRFWLKQRLASTWHSFIEPSVGSSIGTPDLLILLPGYRLPLPVELKVAYRGGHLIRVRRVRPTQILWHDTLARAGGRSCFLVGVPASHGMGFEAWLLPDCRAEVLRRWSHGLPWDTLVQVSDGGALDFDMWKVTMALGQPRQGSQDVAGAEKRVVR